MPQGHARDQHVPRPCHQVKHEQQEVALVFDSNTVVDPRAVMVHEIDAALTNGAVMRPSRLNHSTLVTIFWPKLLEI